MASGPLVTGFWKTPQRHCACSSMKQPRPSHRSLPRCAFRRQIRH